MAKILQYKDTIYVADGKKIYPVYDLQVHKQLGEDFKPDDIDNIDDYNILTEDVEILSV